MKIRFTISSCLELLAIVAFYMAATGDEARGKYYYIINAYGGNDSTGYPRPVKTVFVDIDTKTSTNEIIIGDEGQILNKKALPIALGSDTFLISTAIAGCYCDNAIPGMHRLEIGIMSPITRSMVFGYADSNLIIDTFEKEPGNEVYMSGETKVEPKQTIRGDYTLDAGYHFMLQNPRPADYSFNTYSELGPFTYLRSVSAQMNLYRGSYNNRWYIIRTNPERNMIIDTLFINNTPYRSHIMSVKDSLLFDFNLNWEIHTKFSQKEYDQDRIDSHVKIYNVTNFTLIDSLSVADYPPDNYPDGVFDVADVSGPYIVYYFFGSEGIERRAPAMLFIFDTRTNHATWLRVGWR